MAMDSYARDLAAAALKKGGGGGGGGGGEGDMKKAVYDPTATVEAAGGIAAYVSGKAMPLTVSLTEVAATPGTYTADKTYEQIKAAYDAGVPIQALILEGQGHTAVLPLLNAEVNGTDAGFTFGYTQLQNDAETVSMRTIHYLHTSTDDVWEDNDQSGAYLNKGTGGIMEGPINMGANAITNVQELHVNGEAPVYVGSTVKPAGTAGVRLTGTTDGEAAFVAPDSQSTNRPVSVGTPTKAAHAVPKSTMDTALSMKADANQLLDYLSRTGGNMNGDIDMGAHNLENVGQFRGANYSGAYGYIDLAPYAASFFKYDPTNPTDNGPIPAVVGNATNDNEAVNLGQMNAALATKAPAYTYGTEELTPGVSPLATGTLHFVYE